MKEELIRILNHKLEDVNNDISSLTDLNNKIEEEKEKSDFVSKILNLFNEVGGNNVMNFVKIEKKDFDRVLDIIGDEIKKRFSTESCNYDGLVYLINGINSGISLSLTEDQKDGIRCLIDNLDIKKKEFDSAIDGYVLAKNRYEINNIDDLEDKKAEFTKLLDNFKDNNYIKDINLLKEAISFSDVSPENTIDLLTYILEYNANLYKEGKMVDDKKEPEEEKHEEKEDEDTKENETEFNVEDEFHFNDIDSSELYDLPNITFDDEEKEDETTDVEEVEIPSIDTHDDDYQEYKPMEEVEIPSELDYVPVVEESDIEESDVIEPPVDEPIEEASLNVHEIPKEEDIEIDESKVEEEKIDNDFKDVIDDKNDYDKENVQELEKASTREFQKIFSKYGIEENIVLNELIDGDVSEYQKILDTMQDNNILDYIKTNKELLVEILLYSNTNVINELLQIVKNDLSVDEEDYSITLKIVIDTLPSVFVKDGGNFDNFVKNIELFKELELNLINLFDFSKEIFVADHENIKKNLSVVKKYGFEIDCRNAKYMLLIPNIADKLDYYIESVYDDKLKNEKFDGINYIKDYAAKLNVVTDETIKRLRYSSENGKKVFGSKPGSLSGEITNLKVNTLDISNDYMNKFFNNEFTNLTNEEVREYAKLIHNSSNVGDYSDELDKLNSYHSGLRYNIEGINISYQKVVRNYSILRSYGIDSKKALHFAVCYNLVITKDEYDKLSNLLDKIGGNA